MCFVKKWIFRYINIYIYYNIFGVNFIFFKEKNTHKDISLYPNLFLSILFQYSNPTLILNRVSIGSSISYPLCAFGHELILNCRPVYGFRLGQLLATPSWTLCPSCCWPLQGLNVDPNCSSFSWSLTLTPSNFKSWAYN
jgi:hypothetical protein